jgi:hypothetical protein
MSKNDHGVGHVSALHGLIVRLIESGVSAEISVAYARKRIDGFSPAESLRQARMAMACPLRPLDTATVVRTAYAVEYGYYNDSDVDPDALDLAQYE